MEILLYAIYFPDSDEKDKPVEAIVCNVNDMKNGE